MPIEIRELVIRASVQSAGEGTPTQGAQPPQKAGADEELIATCVEQVLEILRKENER